MVFRITVLILSLILGYFIGLSLSQPIFGISPPYFYGLLAIIVASVFIGVEVALHQAKGRKLFFATIGTILGLIIGFFIGNIFVTIAPISNNFKYLIQFLFAYTGLTLGWLKEDEVKFNFSNSNSNKIEDKSNFKILDTSVIIDGRIADISETGFLEGILVVPKFVLNELHQVADSSDPLKRSRGRRGLDILNNMKASKKAIINITEVDYPDVQEVDRKLLKLAKYMNSVVVTNDFNLNKVAEFEGVEILNVNDLSNAVKPVVLPNEEIKTIVIKEGKDQNQGIAYLEDGTMMVIDNGRNYIGQEVTVVVTSILQTPAGRMIFTQLTNQQKKSSPSHSSLHRR